MWRLSRALYKMSKAASEVEGKKMIYEAYDLIQNALKIKENHWAVHKWISIILDSKCSYEGMKVRIKELLNIKKHMMVHCVLSNVFIRKVSPNFPAKFWECNLQVKIKKELINIQHFFLFLVID